METTAYPAGTAAPPAKSQGEVYEGIAFTFCKAATIILFTGPLALPIAAGAATVFYLLAHRQGQTSSRCILQKPLVIAAFWGAICVVSMALKLRPWLLPLVTH